MFPELLTSPTGHRPPEKQLKPYCEELATSQSHDPFHHYAALFTKCIQTKHLNLGKLLHSHLIKTALIFNTHLTNRLINMYSKCNSIQSAHNVFNELPIKNPCSYNTIISLCSATGDFRTARQLFDEMPEPSLVSYNSMISHLTHHGFYQESINLFREMQKEYNHVFLDEFTIASIVGTCACLGALELLRQVHGVAVVTGLKLNVVNYNALVDGYGKCGRFDWSFMVFSRMPDRDVVSWTSMVVAYARAGRLDDACHIFNQMPVKNTVSWTALIAGFVQNCQGNEALNFFEQMLAEGMQPSAFTYVSILSACADLVLIERGKQLHACITRSSTLNYTNNLFLSNALVDMYSKCGDMKSAVRLFERIRGKDIVTWNSIITGFAQNGHGELVLAIFDRMMTENIKPNHVTFLGVLSGCAHSGLICQGLRILEFMEKEFNVMPRADHYAVMIDLLGRRNRLEEAIDLVLKAPAGSDCVGMWGALLGACRIHGNLDLARTAAEVLFELEPENTARYVMLSNVYAAAGRWDDAHRVRRLVGEKRLQKEAAYSWIDVKGSTHEFVARDQSHLLTEEIYDVLHKIIDQIRDVEYLPYFENSFFHEKEGVP